MSVLEKINETKNKYGAGHWILLDPDKLAFDKIPGFISIAAESGLDAFLIGGSLLLHNDFENFVIEIKKYADNIPVILFPGSVQQITAHADAILFLSLISGREAQHLIGSQVLAAPLIHRTGLETISTAYMIIDSGKPTSAQFMSGTIPLPRNKPEIAVAHALAAKYLGFKLIYLEGGSGAEHSVPVEIISAVTSAVDLPIIVGGGIKTPQEAKEKIKAGASFLVTGNIFESSNDKILLQNFVKAVHGN